MSPRSAGTTTPTGFTAHWPAVDSSSGEGRLAGQGLTDDELMYLGGPLVRQHGLQIVGVAQRRILQGDPAGAENRAAFAGDGQGLADVVQLAEADLSRLKLAGVLQPPQMQREQVPLLQLERHVRELGLGDLVRRQRAIEDLTAGGVVQRGLQAVARRAERTEDDAETRL